MVRFGPALELLFTRIADPDRVLDEVAAEADRRDKLSGARAHGDDLHLPYWAELWDSSLAVGQYLCAHWRKLTSAGSSNAAAAHGEQSVQHAAKSMDPSVLDLGCGMGMAGTAAAALDARVVFADLEPPALLFARLNSLSWRSRVRTRKLNWQTDKLNERFDLILGADILYERVQWEYLEPFWREHLADGGAILLGEPGRQTGDLFLPWIRERGWLLEQKEHPVPTRERPIRLFTLRQVQ